MSSFLRKLKCFRDAEICHSPSMEYYVAFNGTATKAILVQQPKFITVQKDEEF